LLLLASQPRRSHLANDRKRPDGLTFVPWQSGKFLTWDVTVVHTLADSYVNQTSRSAGAAAKLAASRKSAKYADLLQSHLFQLIAVETSGSMDCFTASFFTDFGRKISSVSGKLREASFLFQRISVSVQRFNSVLIRDSFAPTDVFEDQPLQRFAFSLFLTPGIYITEGIKDKTPKPKIIILIIRYQRSYFKNQITEIFAPLFL